MSSNQCQATDIFVLCPFYAFKSIKGIPFVARLVPVGGQYGKDGCLTNDSDESLIEFYDGRYDHNKWTGFVGQFISRYYLSTFSGCITRREGLDLDGGVADWKLSAIEVIFVDLWLQDELELAV